MISVFDFFKPINTCMSSHREHLQTLNILESIFQTVKAIQKEQQKMSVDLTALTAAIQADANIEQEAITAINSIAAEIAAAVASQANTDSGADAATQAQLGTLVSQLTTSTAALSSALASANVVVSVANTAPVANAAPASN
jgi:hypothetical protein